MSAIAIALWYLVITGPNEAAGRQIGPFYTAEACDKAHKAYDKAWGVGDAIFDRHAPLSVCVANGGRQ